MSSKTHINICTVGSVDAGKSTTCGHLIFKLGGISEREMDKLKQRAAELNKSSFAFAFYMDTQKEEQMRGITINTTTKEFYTDQYHYTIVDCPGHRDFVKNMITGASQVEVALILVPADGNFTSSIQKGNSPENGIEGQTRAHSRIINLLGVKQVIVLVNKMDEKMANYSLERFTEIKDEMINMLQKVGFKKDFVENNIPIIPVSSWQGDNLVEPTDKMPWWKGHSVKNLNGELVTVHTVLDALNKFICPPIRKTGLPLRMPVGGIFKIKGVGDVITGRIEQGELKPNDEVAFIPTNCTGKVFSIEQHHKSLPSAAEGDNIGISIKGLNKENMPSTGDIMILKNDKTIGRVKSFISMIQVVDHPGELKVGYCPIACVRTAKCPIRINKINWKIGKETGGKKLENPISIKTNESAEVEFIPQLPFCIEQFDRCDGLGRLAVFEGMSLVFIGKITNVVYE